MPPQYTMRLLKSVQSAARLREWELNSDDIYDETKEHWLRLIRKDFPLLVAQHDYVPKHHKSWHKLYDLYHQLNEQKIADATQKMVQEIAARDKLKQSRQVALVPCEKYTNLQPHRAKPGWVTRKKESQSFIAKTRRTLRIEAPRFKIVTPAATLASSTSQIKRLPESVRNAHRIANQPGILDVNARRAQDLERAAAQVDQERSPPRREQEERAPPAAPKAKPKPNYTIVGNVVSFHDDEGVVKPAEDDEAAADDDDLFGDRLSPVASPDHPKPAGKPAPKPSSAKRARDSTDDSAAVLDRPAKRRRSPSEEPHVTTPQAAKPRPPMPTPASTPKIIPTSAPPKPLLPAPAKRRPRGLSAAPGANSAESTSRRRELLKAPAKRNPTVNPSSSSSASSSSAGRG